MTASTPEKPFEDRVSIRRHWKSKDHDGIRCYASMEGRVTLGDLIQYFARMARHNEFLLEVELNFATATWDDEATKEELDQRRQAKAHHDRRHAEWEWQTYERLKLKFEGPEETP